MKTLLIVAGFAGLMMAQPVRTAANQPISADTPNLPIEKLGPDDLLAISVYDSPELTRAVRVAADGTIGLPMLDDRIKVAGLYPEELERALAAELVRQHVMVNPIITISVLEYRSRPITVSGSVKTPLTFQATGVVTLLDAIARAGGLSENAGAEILVSSPSAAHQDSEPPLMKRIRVKELVGSSDPAFNIRLEGGEEIRVPEAGRVFVVGNVKQPGAFLIQDGAESSLLKALALSQGLLPYAGKTAYIYRTEGGAGSRNEIPIELRKIMDRKMPDVPLLANDIVYIPDAKGRRAALSTLEKALMLGTGLGGAAIYAISR